MGAQPSFSSKSRPCWKSEDFTTHVIISIRSAGVRSTRSGPLHPFDRGRRRTESRTTCFGVGYNIILVINWWAGTLRGWRTGGGGGRVTRQTSLKPVRIRFTTISLLRYFMRAFKAHYYRHRSPRARAFRFDVSNLALRCVTIRKDLFVVFGFFFFIPLFLGARSTSSFGRLCSRTSVQPYNA